MPQRRSFPQVFFDGPKPLTHDRFKQFDCIPGRKQRKTPVKYDKRRYKRRGRIEIMFGRLEEWRRVATRYDRCPKTFFSTIPFAATVIYWL